MNKTILISALIFGATGCSQLPPHDGSMKAIYGVKASPKETKSLHKSNLTQEASIENTETPLIQTVSAKTSSITSINSINHNDSDDIVTNRQAETILEHYYILESDDTLYSVAAELTGSSLNWKEIASYNEIHSPGSISVGAEIIIPEHLLLDSLKAAKQEPKLANPSTAASVANNWETILSEKVSPMPSEKTTSLPPAKISEPSVTEKLKNKATTFASKIKSTIFSDNEDEKQQQKTPSLAQKNSKTQKILISGSYTPKAIYKDAGYNSGLLMRVEPGTRLTLTKTSGNWFQVETKKGTGYIFHRDALLVR